MAISQISAYLPVLSFIPPLVSNLCILIDRPKLFIVFNTISQFLTVTGQVVDILRGDVAASATCIRLADKWTRWMILSPTAMVNLLTTKLNCRNLKHRRISACWPSSSVSWLHCWWLDLSVSWLSCRRVGVSATWRVQGSKWDGLRRYAIPALPWTGKNHTITSF